MHKSNGFAKKTDRYFFGAKYHILTILHGFGFGFLFLIFFWLEGLWTEIV